MRNLLILIIFLFSCSNVPKNSAVEVGVLDSTLPACQDLVQQNYSRPPNNPEIALGLTFEQNQDEVNNRLIDLIRQKKVIRFNEEQKELLRNHNIVRPDISYQLVLNDSIDFETGLYFGYHNSRLYHLRMQGETIEQDYFNKRVDFDDVLRFMTEKFGNYNCVDKSTTSVDAVYHWFDGYKEVSLTRGWGSLFHIDYYDLRAVVDRNSAKLRQDSIEGAGNKELRAKEAERRKKDIK
jgi:hypothetical protein